MIVTRKQYIESTEGIRNVTRVHEARESDKDAVAQVTEVVEAFLAGKLDPIWAKGVGDGDQGVAVTRKFRKVTRQRDPKDRKRIRYKGSESKATVQHVVTAKVETRDSAGRSFDPETMAPVEPFVHVVFADGSQADLPLGKAKRKRKRGRPAAPKPETPEAGGEGDAGDGDENGAD